MILALALAGGLGAACRFLVDGLVTARSTRSVPVGTLTVNVAGSLALGLLFGATTAGAWAADLRLVLGTGFLGGFTTFSTACVETVRLLRAGRRRAALGLALAMLVASVGGAALGLLGGVVLARALTG